MCREAIDLPVALTSVAETESTACCRASRRPRHQQGAPAQEPAVPRGVALDRRAASESVKRAAGPSSDAGGIHIFAPLPPAGPEMIHLMELPNPDPMENRRGRGSSESGDGPH